MRITLILFVSVILSKKWSLKKPNLDEKGGEIQIFKNPKKAPLHILEMHASKFGTIPMKITARRGRYERRNERKTPHSPYRELNLQNSIKADRVLIS